MHPYQQHCKLRNVTSAVKPASGSFSQASNSIHGMMGGVNVETRWLCVAPWRHMAVLWMIFATIPTYTLATTISPTTVQGMSALSEVVTTVLPNELQTQITSGNGLETSKRTTQSNIPSSSVIPTTQKTTSVAVVDELTTSLPSTKVASQSQHPPTSPSRTTSLSTYSTASGMTTSATTGVETTLSSSTIGSSSTVRVSTTVGSSTTVGLSTVIGSSMLPAGSSSPIGMGTTLAISLSKRLTSEEQVSDITPDVTDSTTSASGGGSSGGTLSVVQWFLIAVALAAFIFFVFICYHFCQVKMSKKDQTFAKHDKHFIEYAKPQSPKEKWRNSWALEAMVYHIELPQENSAEMEAKVNVVYEEDETDASSASNHTRQHLTKL